MGPPERKLSGKELTVIVRTAWQPAGQGVAILQPSVKHSVGRKPARKMKAGTVITRQGLMSRHLGAPNIPDANSVGTTIEKDLQAIRNHRYRCRPLRGIWYTKGSSQGPGHHQQSIYATSGSDEHNEHILAEIALRPVTTKTSLPAQVQHSRAPFAAHRCDCLFDKLGRNKD